jgi:hypothetical protein
MISVNFWDAAFLVWFSNHLISGVRTETVLWTLHGCYMRQFWFSGVHSRNLWRFHFIQPSQMFLVPMWTIDTMGSMNMIYLYSHHASVSQPMGLMALANWWNRDTWLVYSDWSIPDLRYIRYDSSTCLTFCTFRCLRRWLWPANGLCERIASFYIWSWKMSRGLGGIRPQWFSGMFLSVGNLPAELLLRAVSHPWSSGSSSNFSVSFRDMQN